MQEVGSDTLHRDEVTGLAAFDDLDPISTVSTLNIMPEPPAPMPRVFAPPPRPAGSVAPPPPGSARIGATLPPPGLGAARAARTFSRPPEVAPLAAPPMAARTTDDTEVVDIVEPASAQGHSYEGWEDPDDAATRVQSSRLLGAAGGVPATELQMDWDDEELPTQMRGESGMPAVGEDLATAAFEPVNNSFPAGRPSPFPSAHTQEALGYARVGSLPPTAAVPSVRPGAPSPFARAQEQQDTAWGQDLRSERPLWLWVSVGVVTILGLALAARAWLSPPTPGLVTLTTVPSDVRVLIDGKPVLASASPFSATDVTPGVTHELLVQKDGFVAQRTPFTVAAGESKALAEIKLVPAVHDFGFAIDSLPQGADVLVDGQSIGQVTPARVIKISAGLHKLQLTHTGYQTFEVQAYVSDNAVLELPTAKLVAASGKAVAAAASAPTAASAQASAAPAEHPHHHHAARAGLSHFASHAAPAAKVAPAPKVASTQRAAAAASSTSAGPSGSKGVLRVNSRPWAQVFVDGKLVGNTPQMAIQLAAGKHSLKLVNQPMGLTKTLSVSIKAGQTVTQVLNLIE
ncbi:MAG TPA: PEGA domain-containing protein [Polyangiales bacterium]